MNPKFKKYQISIRRASDGKLLGVFKGIAEHYGWPICHTRVAGVVVLATLVGSHMGLLAVGFFYLLLAILMRPPGSNQDVREGAGLDRSDAYPPRRETSPRQGTGYRPSTVSRYREPRPRVDLAQLDRQLDGLNRRIQSMETIVTDRQYDWDRRMNS